MGNNSTKQQYGLRITRIMDDSPATKIGLTPFFDFIVDLVDKPPRFDLSTDFYKNVIDNEEKQIKLVIYNQMKRTKRVVSFIPTRNWPKSDFLLGFKVRLENISNAEEQVFRITGLKNKSLEGHVFPKQDFFVGIEEIIYDHLEDLKNKLIHHRRCHVVLYNLEEDTIRTVEVDCEPGYGLGFELASGFLHDLALILHKKESNMPKLKVDEMAQGYLDSEEKTIITNKPTLLSESFPSKVQNEIAKDLPNKDQTPKNDLSENKKTFESENKDSVNLEEEIQIEMS